MPLSLTPLHPTFAAEAEGVSLDQVDAATAVEIRWAAARFGLLVFRGQRLDEDQQVAFTQRLGPLENYGALNSRRRPPRLRRPEIADVSNLASADEVYRPESAQRMNNLANQLWHTDSSFKHPSGRFSVLAAHSVPSWGGETEFADMRTAYDQLADALKAQLADLTAEHSLPYSRRLLGYEAPEHVRALLPPAVQPLVRTGPETGRRSLYLASHACRIVQLPLAEGRLLLADLMAHATQRAFVYAHSWQAGDVLLWDNHATMHRGRPFDERQPRDMRRTTTSDVDAKASAEAAV